MSEKDAQLVRKQFINYFNSIDWIFNEPGGRSLNYGVGLESKMSGLDVSMVFYDPGLEIFSSSPIEVKEDYRFEVMILITELNNLPMIPGLFMFDIENGVISFKTYTHYEGLVYGFSEQMIADLMSAQTGMMETFGDHIVDVAMGYKEADDAIAEIKEMIRNELEVE